MIETLALALEILRSVPYGFLITPGSPPTARLVQHLSVEDDGVVWIGTSPRSRKAHAVTSEGLATYVVEDRSRFAYVSLSCAADVVDDMATRKQLWDQGLVAFFPDGPEGDDFVLVRVIPRVVEVMSFADGVHPDPYGLVPATAERASGNWQEVQPTRLPRC
jgi:general stress protein 26